MKVKDFINGQFQGRHNNLIFYTRGNNTYVRRYAIPGKTFMVKPVSISSVSVDRS